MPPSKNTSKVCNRKNFLQPKLMLSERIKQSSVAVFCLFLTLTVVFVLLRCIVCRQSTGHLQTNAASVGNHRLTWCPITHKIRTQLLWLQQPQTSRMSEWTARKTKYRKSSNQLNRSSITLYLGMLPDIVDCSQPSKYCVEWHDQSFR